MGKELDGAVVLGVVVLNALIGFIQEYKAGKAIEALDELVPHLAAVRREGIRRDIPAAELVVGDIVLLNSGDQVPADLRLIEARGIRIDESALTGESEPVSKQIAKLDGQCPLGDRTNMAYSGTLVTYGQANGLVMATGQETELGKISTLLKQTTHLETPLTKAMARVSTLISLAIVVLSLLLLGIGLYRGYSLVDSLLAAIALAVAAIPEGLPAIITIALAIGVKRMARRHAIVRHLPAVETLGGTTVICSDKTGTLTKNEMTVKEIVIEAGQFSLSGVGYEPNGEIWQQDQPVAVLPDALHDTLKAAILCNDSTVQQNKDNGRWELSGDPTEGSLMTAALKAGISVEEARQHLQRLDVLPFESENKFMASLHQGDSGSRMLYLKGAPEVVAAKCANWQSGAAISESNLRQIVDELASRGMRVLAAAAAEVDAQEIQAALVEGEGKLSLLGFFGLLDPPRPEAIEAVKICQGAGIKVKMITGDHLSTATSIASEFGIGEEAPGIDGSEIEHLSEEELLRSSNQIGVFARVAPEHKLRLVRALQQQGHVVAMTGDGVNDAPALKRADIGVAMGLSGTAVSKEAADIVLTDDNFSSIAAAVEEGRRVYDNLVKSLAFVLPTNLGEAMIILVAVLFFPMSEGVILMPIMPAQILWINLIATVSLALPLGFEARELDVMKRKPRSPKEPILNRFVVQRTILVTLLITIGGVGLFLYEYFGAIASGHISELALREAQTATVTTVVLMQIFYLLNCRSLHRSVLSVGLFTNPAIYIGIGSLLLLQLAYIYLPVMNLLFDSAPMDGRSWLLALITAATVLPVISFEKWIRQWVKKKASC